MTEPMIEVRNFRKDYRGHTAVDNISFTVHRGEMFGLLGPNGAGKTSTLEALEGLRPADSGALRVAGVDPIHEPRKLRQVIGVQLQSGGLPASITADEAMMLFCAYMASPHALTCWKGWGWKRSGASSFRSSPPGSSSGWRRPWQWPTDRR